MIRRLLAILAGAACTVLMLSAAHAATKPACPELDEQQKAQLAAGEVVAWATRDESGSDVATATGVVEIRGTSQQIFEVLCSEAHSVASSKAMKECNIEKDERLASDHRRLTVTYKMKVVTQEFQWTVVRNLYEGQGLLTFEIAPDYDNDIAWTAGQYSIYPGQSADTVLVVYVSNLDSGRHIPRWVEEDLTQGSLKRYLRYLKTATEAG
jgi:hypothetical protein